MKSLNVKIFLCGLFTFLLGLSLLTPVSALSAGGGKVKTPKSVGTRRSKAPRNISGSGKAKTHKKSAGVRKSTAPGYFIGPEDVLEISVWKNTDLSKVVIVRPDGMISLPLIGEVKASSRTPGELHAVIVKKLKKYQETVVVSVIVQAVNSYKIFVMGEVINPGVYIPKRNTTILQAIAMAGGFTQYASKNKIRLIRESTKDGKMGVKFIVSLDDIMRIPKRNQTEESDKNILLLPGDTIFVP